MRAINAWLPLLFLAEFVSAYKQCAMPGGNAGECRPLKHCKPLQELNRKRVKTGSELLYISQSKCGIMANFQIMVCCPPEPLWSKFVNFKPVMFNEIINYERVLKEKDDDTSDKILEPVNKEINKTVSSSNVASFRQQSAEMSDCGKDFSNTNRIIGGGVANIDQYPWLVLLEYNVNETLCGGSLITTKYVLTAAHCIRRTLEPQFARLAEFNTTSYPTDSVDTDGGGTEYITVDRVPIEKNIAHPNYNRKFVHHDIGLSKLSREAVLTDFIRLICLPAQDWVKSFQEPLNFTVAGWGSDGNKSSSEVKKHVRVPYVELSSCKHFYAFNTILDTQICAGGNLEEDSCSGDSGGPLMYETDNTFIAVGVVSYGPRFCGTENVPGVYTYVYPYLNWLYENMV